MRIRGFLLTALIAALVVPAVAGADTTLGTTTQPASSTPAQCPAGPSPPANELLIDVDTSGGPESTNGPLTVPSSSTPQVVTHWAVDATGVTASEQVTLVVLRLQQIAPTPTIRIVGADTETVTAPASPAADVESFTVSQPIEVQAGDIIGQYASGSPTGLTCYWDGIPGSSDELEGLPLASAPVAGQQIDPTSGPAGINSGASELNLSATLSPGSYDAGLSLTATPSNAVSGQPALLTATVTNHGSFAAPIAFTDPIPAGLSVDYVAANSGACTTSTVNIVTCTLSDVPAGQSEKVAIVVTPTAALSYSDSGTVSLPDGAIDPNSANNTAAVTLHVTAPGAPTECVVPKLGGASLTFSRKVLSLLGCKVGKVKKAKSKKVPKGDVIATNPRAGKYALGRTILITVSSGKPKKKKKKHKK